MSWHKIPRDDAWKQVSPASVDALGQMLWLRCACGRNCYVEPLSFADRHGLDHRTPLLRISQALRCSKCGEKKGWCAPKPYGIDDR
ncbi:MAG: hypothetical protein AB7O43_15810 [Hyphomicrobiaceae bacterium]